MKKNVKVMPAIMLVFMLIFMISGTAFADEIRLPSSLTTIEAEAFMGDTSLDSVVIPSGVTAIKARTFANSSLRSITIPASVRSVAADAFSGTYPDIYVEDINSLSGNLAGTVYLTRNSTISSAISYSEATLVVTEGVTLTITADGALEGTDLAIYGTVINRGTLMISEEIATYDSGLLSVPDTNAFTELPDSSFYSGELNFRLAEGVQVHVSDGVEVLQIVTAIGLGSHTADVTYAGERVRFCFVPSESGSYIISSTGDVDTYVHLMNASGTQIASDDDGMGDRNFRLSYDLTAGDVYFYDVRYYNQSSTTGTISFVLSADNCGSVTITSQPSNVAALNNETVHFSVTASGDIGSYQWGMLPPGMLRDHDAQPFEVNGEMPVPDVLNNWMEPPASVSNTPTLTFTASEEYNNYFFRCAVTNSCGTETTYSNMAIFYYVQGTMQMGTNSAVISSGGQIAKFRFIPPVSGEYTLISTGTDDTKGYLFDESMTQLAYNDDTDGSNFNVTYELTANTVYYYGVCYYSGDRTGTISLILSSAEGPSFTQQPSNVTAISGDNVSFSVTATGNGTLSYQWQELASGSSTWQNSTRTGNRTRALNFTAQLSQDNTKFRCVVTDGDGLVSVSNEAVLYVQESDAPVYRALFISETYFTDGSTQLTGNPTAVRNLSRMLETVTGPTGGRFTVYGGSNEYDGLSPEEILSTISSTLGAAKDNDVSLFFINSHGIASIDGAMAGAIATVRTTDDRRYCENYTCYDTTDLLLLQELANKLKTIKGKVIVWIDTCGSGAGIYDASVSEDSGQEDFDPEMFNRVVLQAFADADEEISEVSDLTGELRVSNKFYVLTSAAHRELGWTSLSLGSYFSQGIRSGIGSSGIMPADEDSDGYVTQQELYQYTYNFVIQYNFGDQGDQKEHVQGYPENSSYQLFKR